VFFSISQSKKTTKIGATTRSHQTSAKMKIAATRPPNQSESTRNFGCAFHGERRVRRDVQEARGQVEEEATGVGFLG
jgi:hypothetical protein